MWSFLLSVPRLSGMGGTHSADGAAAGGGIAWTFGHTQPSQWLYSGPGHPANQLAVRGSGTFQQGEASALQPRWDKLREMVQGRCRTPEEDTNYWSFFVVLCSTEP